MKANTRTLRLAPLFTLCLLAGDPATAAQTVGDSLSYISSPGMSQTTALGGPGDFNQTLAASGYTSQVYAYLNGADLLDDTITTGGAEIGVQQGGTLGANGGNNRIASGIDLGSFSFQGGPSLDGSVETISSIVLLLYITSASITAPNPMLHIYAGLNNKDLSAPSLGSFTVSQAQVGNYISIGIPLSVAFSGFTIANFAQEIPQDANNFGAEGNGTVSFQPAYRVNTVYVIPEPSAALMGGLGVLFLLRRNRRS